MDYVVKESSMVAVADAIRNQTKTTEQLVFPNGFVSAVESINADGAYNRGYNEGIEKGIEQGYEDGYEDCLKDGVPKPELWEGVNFIDYDGTVIETWTPQEVESKTELPTPPTHDDFIDGGWNWELSQIKTYMGENPQACIYVGAEYNVKNGDTVIFVSLADNTQLSPMVVLGVNGTVTIDWGDGTTTDVTGTNQSTAISTTHTYGTLGNYKIKISGNQQIVFFYNYTNYDGGSLFCGNQYYKNCVKEVWLGNVKNTNNPILYRFPSMERVLISKAFEGGLSASFLTSTNNLRCVVLHSKISGVGYPFDEGNTNLVSYNPFSLNSFAYSNHYNGCVYLPYKYDGESIKSTNNTGILFRKVTIPNNQHCIRLPDYFMYGCEYVGGLVIPSYIAMIGSNAFNYCKSLQEIHFKPTTPPLIAASNAFTNVPTTCKIYVPKGTLSAYTQATNYPDSNTYTYVEE